MVFMLNSEIISLKSNISVSFLSKGDKEFRLCVIIDALMPVFIQLTAEKSLSTVYLVMSWVTRARRTQFILGNMSVREALSIQEVMSAVTSLL